LSIEVGGYSSVLYSNGTVKSNIYRLHIVDFNAGEVVIQPLLHLVLIILLISTIEKLNSV